MDAAIGWGLIIAIGLVVYFGTSFVLRFVIREIRASREQQRLHRERIEEEQDERFRQELLDIVAREQAEPRHGPGAESS
jgi:hypothetical protein